MPKPRLSWLLVFVPVSIVVEFGFESPVGVFLTSTLAILPLAGLLGRATDQLAIHVGPRLGGLLNASLGNLAELLIGIFLVLDHEFEVVKATLTGSILGNLLLVLGLSFLAGGLKHEEQAFNRRAAGTHTASLTLAVIGLMMPALFHHATPGRSFAEIETVSAAVGGVLIALYVLALLFMLGTHEHLFRTPTEEEHAEWDVRKSVLVLVGAAVLVGFESELLAGALERASADLHLPKFFVGLILLPIVGNAAEHGAAVLFAVRNKMDIALEIAIGSSTQVALFVAPLLIFVSLLAGRPMDFVFTPFEIAAVGLATLITAIISLDGRSNWLEGAQLVGAYSVIAISAAFLG